MAASNSRDGNWQTSQGSLADVLEAMRTYVNNPSNVVGFAYDSGNTNWVVLYKVDKGD